MIKLLALTLSATLALAAAADAQNNTRWTDPTGAWSVDFTPSGWGHAEGLPPGGPILMIAPAAAPGNAETRLCFAEEKTEAVAADADTAEVQNRAAQMGPSEIAAAFPRLQLDNPQIAHALIDAVAVAQVNATTHGHHFNFRGRVFVTAGKGEAVTSIFFCISAPYMPAAREAEVETILASLHFGAPSSASTAAPGPPINAVTAPYVLPGTMPDQAAQLAEAIALYDDICFHNFPDDAAVARAMTARHATPMSPAEVRDHLHDDPGVGWFVDGATGRSAVTIERPPYHACAVRVMAAPGGFTDMKPYDDFAAQKENGRAGQHVGPVQMPVSDMISRGWGVSLPNGSRNVENLLVFATTPAVAPPAGQRYGTEVRFVRQLVTH